MPYSNNVQSYGIVAIFCENLLLYYLEYFILAYVTTYKQKIGVFDISIYTISEKAGVSIATVSRVINGSENVSDKTRKKVLAVMEQENYTPNAFARGLGLNSMRTIGIMCSNSSDIFLAQAIYRLEQGLRKHNYDSLLCCTGYDRRSKEQYIKVLQGKRVDAIILVGSDFISETNNDYITKVAETVPVFLLNSFLDSENIYSILVDDTDIVCNVTKNLLESGIDDILFICRRESYGSTQKQNGFTKAYAEHNKEIANWQIKTLDADITEMDEFLEDFRKQHTFRAVITSDDELAIAVIKFARNHNINIPDELSIIGYNNSKLSRYCEPELSSIDNKPDYCCNSIVNNLLEVLDGKSVPSKTIISAEYIKRGTTI